MTDSPRVADELTELEFEFEKSAHFRVIHVDGAFGGVSPGTRLINMAVYNERSPIPKSVTHSVHKGGLGPEIREKRTGRTAIFREVEANLIMNLDIAIAVRAWLDEKIGQLQKAEELLVAMQERRQQKRDN
jgi:hypothetical protein